MTNLTKATANGQVSFSEQETAEHNAAITAWTAGVTDRAAAEVRTTRDGLLADTDWTGMSDVTMTAEMAAYRQALRDITSHANFPDLETEDWPTAP
tara:strand:+ start:1073 stop:1360 length:288 start_codon:yes stop_codon:yes gene_type:complete